MDIATLLIIFILLILCSAFFSSSETSFFALSKFHLSVLENSGKRSDRQILKLLRKPRRLLFVILLGNTLVNVFASATATMIAIRYAENMHQNVGTCVTIQIIITTLVVLLFGEVIPKLLAYSMPETIARFSGYLLEVLEIIFYPILIILEWFTRLISRKDSFSQDASQNFTTEDFQNLIASKTSNHPLEDEEKKIIASIFRLSTTEVREIIVPRVDIVAVDVDSSIDDLKNVLLESGYSRLPVYQSTIDDIIGVIYAKDLILYPEKTNLRELMRAPYFVTENMKIQILLNQFRSKKLQIAIVVDEYGGTSGLITLEDILEELVGEIMDEYDEDEPPMLTKLNDREFIVSGMYSISELNHEFNFSIDSAEYDNVADFLLGEFNRIPKKGESIVFQDTVQFLVTNIKGQRIHYVKMRLMENEDHASE